MKRFVKVLAIVLCLSMFSPSVMTNIGIETVEAKTKTPKLSKTKVEIPETYSARINLKNADSGYIKWSSSNKKVATVNKHGKIKGLKHGKTTITAKYKNKTYKCKVTVLKYGKKYISSEIIGEVDGFSIIKYTNESECDINITISDKYYDEDGYFLREYTRNISCLKNSCAISYYQAGGEHIIKSILVAVIDDISKIKPTYEINTDNEYYNELTYYITNNTSKDVQCKLFILFYDNDGSIVKFKDFNTVSLPKDEIMRATQRIDKNIEKVDIFVIP